MRSLISILLISLSFGYLSQNDDIRIFDGHFVKADLKVITDNYAYLILDEFDLDHCVLFEYDENRDTVALTHSDDYIEWGSDVFFHEQDSIKEGYVAIEATFRHAFIEGGAQLQDCYYFVNNKKKYPVLSAGDTYHRRIIKRPESSVFDLKIYKEDDVLVKQYQIDLTEEFNVISIENVDMFTLNDSAFKYWNLFPIKVNFKNTELILVLE